MITQYASPVVVNPSQNFWLDGDGVVVSSNIAVPSLDLNFLTGQLPSNVTFTRSDATLCASYFDSTGTLQLAAANEPRFDYDPATLQPRGFLIEQSRANLILFSDAPATQSVTVSATAYTLSFYGTGTVTLSGVATATVVGTGAFPTRTTYTFTPTAGPLILTITGTVEYANLEAGAFATSWIATTASSATRAADAASVNTLSPWFNATEGTFVAQSLVTSGATSFVSRFVGAATNIYMANGYVGSTGTPTAAAYIRNGAAAAQISAAISTKVAGTVYKEATRYSSTSFREAANGTLGNDVAPSAGIPTVSKLDFAPSAGSTASTAVGQLWMQRFTYYPRPLSDAELTSISA